MHHLTTLCTLLRLKHPARVPLPRSFPPTHSNCSKNAALRTLNARADILVRIFYFPISFLSTSSSSYTPLSVYLVSKGSLRSQQLTWYSAHHPSLLFHLFGVYLTGNVRQQLAFITPSDLKNINILSVRLPPQTVESSLNSPLSSSLWLD